LNLEFGVLVKFDQALTDGLSGGQYAYRKIDAAIPISYFMFRQEHDANNKWLLIITSGGCVIRADIEQDEDEQLWTGGDEIDFVALGACAGDSPIDTLSAKMYRTQKAAQVDWPDVQLWDWS
jgi:hypothetical protein